MPIWCNPNPLIRFIGLKPRSKSWNPKLTQPFPITVLRRMKKSPSEIQIQSHETLQAPSACLKVSTTPATIVDTNPKNTASNPRTMRHPNPKKHYFGLPTTFTICHDGGPIPHPTKHTTPSHQGMNSTDPVKHPIPSQSQQNIRCHKIETLPATLVASPLLSQQNILCHIKKTTTYLLPLNPAGHL